MEHKYAQDVRKDWLMVKANFDKKEIQDVADSLFRWICHRLDEKRCDSDFTEFRLVVKENPYFVDTILPQGSDFDLFKTYTKFSIEQIFKATEELINAENGFSATYSTEKTEGAMGTFVSITHEITVRVLQEDTEANDLPDNVLG